jgi:hypothetical protein
MKRVSVDLGRVSLPAEMVKAFGDPMATEDIPVWLFLVDPGHLRVMADRSLPVMLGFDPVGLDALTLATREERERLAAIRMRLFSTVIKPVVKRLVIPAEVFDACEEELDRKHVWIDHPADFVDVYLATYRRTRLATPSDKLFSGDARE